MKVYIQHGCTRTSVNSIIYIVQEQVMNASLLVLYNNHYCIPYIYVTGLMSTSTATGVDNDSHRRRKGGGGGGGGGARGLKPPSE